MKRLSQWLVFPLAVAVLAGVIFYNRHLIAQQMDRPAPRKEQHITRPDVSVINAAPESYSANLQGYGQTTPHYETTLTAQVEGQVISFGKSFETGALLKKGEVILQLDDTTYTASVASAESELAEARLAYLEEERQAEQAKAEWAASGLEGEPNSELVLRGPQLEAARTAVKNKEAELVSARSNLAKTVITAPFDCLVVERKTTPGSYLQAGAEVALLYSTDLMEINVAFSAKDWKNLPPQNEFGKWPVSIDSVETNDVWSGAIARLEQHLDTDTRQRTAVITVDDPLSLNPPLLAGTFVTISMPGRQTDNLLKLPGSALSQRGEIWYVTPEGTLDRFSAEPLFSDSDSIYITAPADFDSSGEQVLTHPLSSYLVGMAVHPVTEGGEEQEGQHE